MTLHLDPEVAAALPAPDPGTAPPARGDWQARRAGSLAGFAAINDQLPPVADVTATDHEIDTIDGAMVLGRWYEPARHRQVVGGGPAVVFFHGGAMILGSVDAYDRTVRGWVAAAGVPILAVDYRLAPEHPFPIPQEDCYAGLGWLVDHAAQLSVDPARIAVMGDSAGGALAAGVSLMSADRGGPAIARQLLLAPMLDDREPAHTADLERLATFGYDDCATGWSALLGAAAGGDAVSPYAAPARAADLSRLPPTFIDVGQVDILCDQDLNFARRLAAAGVPMELHVHPGAVHAFELQAPNSYVARRATADRVRVLRSL